MADVNEIELRLRTLASILQEINGRGLIERGYMCGLSNGIRVALSVISGEDAMFERNEALPPGEPNAEYLTTILDGKLHIGKTFKDNRCRFNMLVRQL